MGNPVIFFDDLCVLCSRSVQFIYRNDRKGRFMFASLDSEAFRRIAPLVEMEDTGADSVILYDRGKVWLRSSAALRIASRLRFPVMLLTAGFIFPRVIRDAIYDWIARKRYSWFGKRESCFVPDPGLRERVLD